MARMTKEQKRIEKAVEAAFNKYGSNRQFNIMDLNNISIAGSRAAATGQDIAAAVKMACDLYEVKPK